jgi:hypothetical protein
MKNNFTSANSAMLLIDHQQGTIKPARNLPHTEIVKNTRSPSSDGKGNGNAAGAYDQHGNQFPGDVTGGLEGDLPRGV